VIAAPAEKPHTASTAALPPAENATSRRTGDAADAQPWSWLADARTGLAAPVDARRGVFAGRTHADGRSTELARVDLLLGVVCGIAAFAQEQRDLPTNSCQHSICP